MTNKKESSSYELLFGIKCGKWNEHTKFFEPNYKNVIFWICCPEHIIYICEEKIRLLPYYLKSEIKQFKDIINMISEHIKIHPWVWAISLPFYNIKYPQFTMIVYKEYWTAISPGTWEFVSKKFLDNFKTEFYNPSIDIYEWCEETKREYKNMIDFKILNPKMQKYLAKYCWDCFKKIMSLDIENNKKNLSIKNINITPIYELFGNSISFSLIKEKVLETSSLEIKKDNKKLFSEVVNTKPIYELFGNSVPFSLITEKVLEISPSIKEDFCILPSLNSSAKEFIPGKFNT